MLPPLSASHWVIYGLVVVACILLVALTASRDMGR